MSTPWPPGTHQDAQDRMTANWSPPQRAIATSTTLQLADGNPRVLHVTSAAAVTITLPTDASVAIPQEVAIPWRQYGAGQITFAAAAGATLVSRDSAFKSFGQYSEGVVTKVAANAWLLSGDITV